MANAVQTYSSFFQCLFDQPVIPGTHYPAYSVFRAIDSRDVEQHPTPLPRIHDFAVIWDDDHDTRIIAVIEEMLMAGLLPGVQFIGEHKGMLTVVLAARTYWKIDVEAYAARVHDLTAAAGDYWPVRVGMYDHSKGNLRHGHQCDFQELAGLGDEAEHAFLYTLDTMWTLGTKEWKAVDVPDLAPLPGTLPPLPNRYSVRRPLPR